MPTFTNHIYKLLDAATAVTVTPVQFVVNKSKRNYSMLVAGTGAVSASVSIYGSLDGSTWELMATLSASGTTSAHDQVETTRQWRYTYAAVTAISGTSAAVTVLMESI